MRDISHDKFEIKRFDELITIRGNRCFKITESYMPRVCELMGAEFLFGFEYEDGKILNVPNAFKNVITGNYSSEYLSPSYEPVCCVAVLLKWKSKD
jgi:hypothetical protein